MTDHQPDWATLLQQATPRTKTVRLCLRGDLLSELEDARAALLEAERASSGSASLSGESEDVTLLRKRVDEARGHVEQAAVAFTVKGINRAVYAALEAKHPDPKGDGWDMATFPEALIRECLVSPVVAADQPLVEALTYGEFDKLFAACVAVCIEVNDVPLPRRG